MAQKMIEHLQVGTVMLPITECGARVWKSKTEDGKEPPEFLVDTANAKVSLNELAARHQKVIFNEL